MLMVGEYEFLSGVLISVIHWNPLLCLFGYHYLICLCILSLLSLLCFLLLLPLVPHYVLIMPRPQLISHQLLGCLLSMMFCSLCYHVFRLVRGVLVFGRMLFLSGSLHIVPLISILAVLPVHVMLPILGFVSRISLLVSLSVPCSRIRAKY